MEQWFKYERAKVFQDKEGRPIQMNFAVIDTIKWDDLPNDTHSSKNICIPLRKDLILSVLSPTPIDENTPFIEVRIRAEKGFKPNKDLDIASLRLGSYTEVNFGRGCRPLHHRKEGKDLIVTFEGKGHGITPDEFAPKLLGKDKRGEPMSGYARLPYVNYAPPVLSPLKSRYDAQKRTGNVEVQKFGLSASQPTTKRLTASGVPAGEASVPALQPYEKTTVSVPASSAASKDGNRMEVVLYRGDKTLGQNRF